MTEISDSQQLNQHCIAWPRTKNGWTQAVGVCDARGAAYLAFGWFDLTPTMYADFGAHDVRATNWQGEAVHA